MNTSRIFDAHLHILDPRFPRVANHGYLPPDFTVDAYLAEARPLGVGGGAVVSGSFQAFDQGYLQAALTALGPTYVGVTQLPEDVPSDRLEELDAIGVRALRFNLRPGGSAGVDALEALARRAHARVGWHVELYAEADALLDLEARLRALPRVVVDHLGLSEAALPVLLRLVEGGARVKATGFGRYHGDLDRALRSIAAADPGALLFGTDLPSTRAPRPFSVDDLERLRRALDDDALVRRALADNALALYRPRALPSG
ncbi:MAG: amidohydrolase family protein [Nannocystaceae bacterium]